MTKIQHAVCGVIPPHLLKRLTRRTARCGRSLPRPPQDAAEVTVQVKAGKDLDEITS
jgi:hypothetical protein